MKNIKAMSKNPTNVHTDVHAHVNVHMYIYIYIHIYICIYTYAYTCGYDRKDIGLRSVTMLYARRYLLPWVLLGPSREDSSTSSTKPGTRREPPKWSRQRSEVQTKKGGGVMQSDLGAQPTHIIIRILFYSVHTLGPHASGIPEIIFGRILTVMWLLGP